MKKKSQDELGTLVTREMKVMLQDKTLTKEQRFDVLMAVMFDEAPKDKLLGAFANSLKAGYEQINSNRYKAIDRIREFKKRSERIRRNGENMEENKLPSNSIPIHGAPCVSIPIHGKLKARAKQDNITPYNPPKGGGEVDKIADSIEQTEAFRRMRVNRRNLLRCLKSLAEKNIERFEDWRSELMHGLLEWTEAWSADDWQFAPGKITTWLKDEKYLQEPRKKTGAANEGVGCGKLNNEVI